MKKIFTQLLFVMFCITASSATMYAQGASIKGAVMTLDGEPLLGANIFIQNTTIGTISDPQGAFEINNLDPGDYMLEVSYVGYESNVKKLSLSEGETVYIDFEMDEASTRLSEVYVKGEVLKLENSTITVDVINNNRIKNMSIEQPLRLLEDVPGINVVAYGQGGVADQFSIRGFGGGGHEGHAGIEVDGISLNEAEGHSDGYADMNVLIPLNLSKIKVYKGPSSALFGRFAQGGTIALETRKSGQYNDISIKGGSYNTLDAQYAFGNQSTVGSNEHRLQTNFAMQLFKTDGYHENADILKGNVDGRIGFAITDRSEISLSLRGHKSNWNAPGYITKEQYEKFETRNLPAPEAENDGGAKTFFSQRVDYNHKVSDDIKLLVFGYALQQDFTRFAKFGKQSERFNTRNAFAGGASLNGNSTIADMDFDWITGLEYYTESTDRQRWWTNHRVRDGLYLDRYFDIQSISAFAQGELNLHKMFRPSIGLRFDTYKGEYRFKDPGKDPSTSKIKNLSHFGPRLGFRSTLIDHLDFRANVSNGFSLPNSAVKYTASDKLDPVQLWQYEVGLSYNDHEMFDVDVAAFILNSSQEVVTDPNNPDELINAGKTARKGIEAKANISVMQGLFFRSGLAITETEILTGDDKGQALTHIPGTIASAGVSYTSPIGLGVDFDYRSVSDYFTGGITELADGSKTRTKGGGYDIANLTIFYSFDGLFPNKGRVFFTVNNLFDEVYAETIFGNSSYASSPTRNYALGVNYSF